MSSTDRFDRDRFVRDVVWNNGRMTKASPLLRGAVTLADGVTLPTHMKLADTFGGRISQVDDLFRAAIIDTRGAYELLNGHLDGAPPAGTYCDLPDVDDDDAEEACVRALQNGWKR